MLILLSHVKFRDSKSKKLNSEKYVSSLTRNYNESIAGRYFDILGHPRDQKVKSKVKYDLQHICNKLEQVCCSFGCNFH